MISGFDLSAVRKDLLASVDGKTLSSQHHFFREEVKLYGVPIPVVNRISQKYRKEILELPKALVLDLCEELWLSGVMEESFIACNWSYWLESQFEPGDFEYFKRWIHEYVSNWASCDTLCNHTVGTFAERYPEFIPEFKAFALSPNRWVRRAAAVTFIIPAQKGLFLRDILEIADILLMDTDDLVQKGYGWMLKAASESHRDEIYNFVLSRKDRMPRTALRYALEKMPPDMKKTAMQK